MSELEELAGLMPRLTEGIHDGIPAVGYHGDSSWGSSALKAMRQGPPSRVIWERANPRTSDALAFGTAVHCKVLTPELFNATYAHKPHGMSFANKAGMAWREEHAGRAILTHDQSTAIDAIQAALVEKDLTSDLILSDAHRREVSLFWRDEDTGELCKGRIDLFADAHIYDLKVSRYAGSNIAYRAFCEGWLHQLAHYRAGAQQLGLYVLGARLIVVSPVAPHYVWTVEVKPDALDLLALENSQTLYALGKCRAADDWPGTPDEWTRIEPPPSALIHTAVLDNLPEEE